MVNIEAQAAAAKIEEKKEEDFRERKFQFTSER